MRVLDLFSGIGGFSRGLERAGMKTVAFCEIDQFCRRVLAKHWPDVPCHEDVTTYEFAQGEADIIVGGFPCQDVSLAGKRAGLSGERSGLYRELVRALRVVRPSHGILENVAALLSDGMGTVLGDLAESGFDAEWDCVPACAIGAPHERDRVWIVAHANSEWRQQSPLSRDAIGLRAGDCAEDAAHTLRDGRCFSAPRGLQSGTAIPDEDRLNESEEARRSFVESRISGRAVADVACQQMGPAGQPRQHERVEPSHSDAASERCGQRRTRRPPDSFAGVRIEARRNAADPYNARLAFREGLTRDAWKKLTPAERDACGNVRQCIWPDEPALSGVDDGIPDWLDRTKSTGNTVLPQIPEIIGRAILAATARAA